MLKRIECRGEQHMLGGDGAVYYADFRKAEEALLSSERGGAAVVYLDPPPREGTACELRLGSRRLGSEPALGSEEYEELIRSAVRLSYELLSEEGTLFFHTEPKTAHRARMILDEVFGEEAFTNEIVRAYKTGGRSVNSFARRHDIIFMYRKSPAAYFDISAVARTRGAKRRNHMKRGVDPDGRTYYSIRMKGREYRYYEDDPVYLSDVWDDIDNLRRGDPELTGYLYQRPEALLRRLILAASKEGDTVIDLFGGSGTAAYAAASLGRRFITVDNSPAALAVTRSRLVERCFQLRLYEFVSPLSVHYASAAGEGEPFPPEKYFDISKKGGRLIMKVKRLEKEGAPYYAARGHEEGGLFMASDYLMRFREGETVSLKPGQCLHLVDERLNSAFYEYTEE